MQFDNTKKILCYCTVCISGLIDDFFGLGGEGGHQKNCFYWGEGGSWKKFNDWGVLQLFNDSSKNPTSPLSPTS